MMSYLTQLISNLDILSGNYIQLEPILPAHREGMRMAAAHEQIWIYMPNKATKNGFDPWFDGCLHDHASRKQIWYAVRRKNDSVILGATAYYDMHWDNQRLSLGYSWYTPEVWGTIVNPEAKLLMFSQAFETWFINRVEMGTDSRNTHSWNAIKKLGATQEGILRQHMILHDNVVTDTVIFSMLATEWPSIKLQLKQRINQCLST